jgi:hypothetical protein
VKNKQVAALIAATVLVGCGVGAGIYISNNQVTITQTENRLDLLEGDDLDFHLEDFVEVSPESALDKITVDASEVNTAEAGNYNIYLSYKDETYTVAVNVVAPAEEAEEVETDADYMALMLSHVTNENGSYVMDDELAEVLMDLDIAKGATVDEVNWWLNQSDSAYFGPWLDVVCGKENEQKAVFAEQRMWVLQDLGDADYNIHDVYTKAHQSSSGSSNSSSNSSSSSSSNSSSSSSSDNSSSSSGDSSSNSSAGSDGGSATNDDYNSEFDDEGAASGTIGISGGGGSSGNDFGGCITWR